MVALLLLASIVLLPVSHAHEPNTFTVIVRSGEHAPSSVSLVINDTVQYKNEDHRENITHYIGFDTNQDGDFNDEGEFSSGPLNATCDWTNDTGCRTAWILIVNNTSYIGTYTLVDYTNTNETHNITLIVEPDNHGGAPNIGSCFGDCEDEVDEQIESEAFPTKEQLMRGAAFSIYLAAFLGISILARPNNEN